MIVGRARGGEVAGCWFAAGVLALVFSLTESAPSLAADACPGPPPKIATTIRGPVLQRPDSGVLCIAASPSPLTWRPVRLSRPAPDRSTLMAAAFARNASCIIGSDGTGACVIDGEALADELRRAEENPPPTAWR